MFIRELLQLKVLATCKVILKETALKNRINFGELLTFLLLRFRKFFNSRMVLTSIFFLPPRFANDIFVMVLKSEVSDSTV